LYQGVRRGKGRAKKRKKVIEKKREGESRLQSDGEEFSFILKNKFWNTTK